jgi:hypothetical protein
MRPIHLDGQDEARMREQRRWPVHFRVVMVVVVYIGSVSVAEPEVLCAIVAPDASDQGVGCDSGTR